MHWINRVFLVFSFLAIPIALLLFAQWPLRDWVQAGSRLANDWGQVSFGLYMATAITAASVAGVHLAAHVPWLPHTDQAAASGWRVWAVFACVAPWAAFILWTYLPNVLQSVVGLERFPETGNPGYFALRLAVFWMALAALVFVVVSVVRSMLSTKRSA